MRLIAKINRKRFSTKVVYSRKMLNLQTKNGNYNPSSFNKLSELQES